MGVFEFNDYKEIIRRQIAENRLIRGYQAQLAEAANCQRSFLSKILNSDADLSPDHAAGLGRFWRLKGEEARYFVLLVHLARATHPALKEMLREQLKACQTKGSDLGHRIGWPSVGSAQREAVYFSSWYWSAIHVLLAVPRFQDPRAIAERLRLPLVLVNETLGELEKMGLIAKKGARRELSEARIHLPKSSFMTEMNHFNWRHRAIENIQRQDSSALHYSLVFGISQEDLGRLREDLISQLQKWHELIGPSRSEEGACITLDLFRI